MVKVTAVARVLVVILAILSAFVTNPILVPILILLGCITAIGNTPERNSKNYLITLVLILGAKTLEAIPTVGIYLATIFAALGVAFVGASIASIAITLEYRILRDWKK
jgi:hypothetical protein